MNINFENNFKSNILNSNNYQEVFKLDLLSKDSIVELYRKLYSIRQIEFKIANGRKSGLIGGPVHLCAGQEAIAVGVSSNLNKKDFIFGAHRSHAHLLALGSSIEKLFAELLGRSTGLSKGRGGSMHLIDNSVGFKGSVPIVGGTISLAVGAALAISQEKSNSVAISYLGDGAVEEGVFHESLNLAKILNLPVIFVIENNLFSSHLDIADRQPSPFTSRFSEANKINHRLVDGNNLMEVIQASKELIEEARRNNTPGFLEAITYRWFGHVDWREDIDVGKNRCIEEVNNWKKRCPLKRFKESILISKILSEEVLSKINLEEDEKIETSWNQALKAPFPKPEEVYSYVYGE